MKERRIEHIYDCSAAVFWDKIFLDEEYNRKLFLEQLHFSVWRVLRSEERGSELHRTIEATPRLGDLPAVLKKLLSDGLGYEEHGILDRPNQRYRLEVKPRSLASKLTIQGDLSTQPLSDHSCRRIYVARAEARVLGVGGMIEQRLLDDIEKSYNKSAVFTNLWIAERFPQKLSGS
jgi:Protein of unknown function (DUF2505)